MKTATVRDVYDWLNQIAPFDTTESYDNAGLLLGSMSAPAERILVALDATPAVIDEAIAHQAQLIVTHHPLIFKPLSRLAGDSTSTRIIKCIENGLSVASFHTCLDIAEGGVNDTLCEKLGIENTTAFLPFGRIGDVREQSFADFCVFASEALKCIPFQTVDAGRSVRRVAVVSGGGKDEVRDAYDAGADTYLTGEASHSAMIDAAEYGINMLCCGHFETENPVVPVLAGIISKHFPDIEVITLGS